MPFAKLDDASPLDERAWGDTAAADNKDDAQEIGCCERERQAGDSTTKVSAGR